MEAALEDADKTVCPCMGRIDGQQHEEAHSQTDQDTQQGSHHAGDRTLQPVVGKFFVFHFCLLLSLLAGTGHVQAQLLDCGGLGVKLAHDLTLVHHKDPVRKVHHLVQLQTDQQHGLASVALIHDLLMDILNGTDIQAAGGCTATSSLGSLSISRAMIAFCWLPPDMLRTMVALPWPLRTSYWAISLSEYSRTFSLRIKPLCWNSGCQ